ncbi:MAG TPA: tetratricopeptide repeat protein [Bacteroidia bacterium]|nr:tetratricopeptide repeat protein [Bacteroidia bacterium]
MSKETKDQPVLDIEGAFDKTEQYIEQNRKSLLLIVGGVVALVGIFFGWKYFYQKPRSEEAAAQMYKAEMYFARDSFKLAINGKGDTAGFAGIADNFGMTPSGNLAKYYLGISYLREGKFDEAIETLEDFDTDDMFLSSMKIALIGDAYMEKGQTDDAIDHYLKAARKNPNKLTTPVYLKKAAFAYEDKGEKAEAVKLYEQIKADFPESQEAAQIDKYIARNGGTVK